MNLIGDHTDYAGGLALPMAIDLGTTVRGSHVTSGHGSERVLLRSSNAPTAAGVPLGVTDPARVEPAWARYVAGVVHELRPACGFDGDVVSTVPVGSGLSSSAALELALAMALGFEGSPLELAKLCQRAEQIASGVPCGIMDQLCSASGVDGHALLIDFSDLTVEPVPVPATAEIVVVHSGQQRSLAGSAYADRRAATEAATLIVGPLRDIPSGELDQRLAAIADPVVARRARHVVTENDRVRQFAEAFAAGELARAGSLMDESHRSLATDFDVSTPELDDLVSRLRARSGVWGSRLTGAGFGGCAVALTSPGALTTVEGHIDLADPTGGPAARFDAWVVRASDGARRLAD